MYPKRQRISTLYNCFQMTVHRKSFTVSFLLSVARPSHCLQILHTVLVIWRQCCGSNAQILHTVHVIWRQCCGSNADPDPGTQTMWIRIRILVRLKSKKNILHEKQESRFIFLILISFHASGSGSTFSIRVRIQDSQINGFRQYRRIHINSHRQKQLIQGGELHISVS